MQARLEMTGFATLLKTLQERGYQLIGPQVRDGAIQYDTITEMSDLPIGWTDVQEAGQYRLKRRTDQALFGYVVGPQSWKKLFLPPRQRLWRAEATDDGFSLEEEPLPQQPLALIGVRACELQAIAIQDRVLMEGAYVDPYYKKQREQSFLVAVNCGQAGGTCFCVSMDTGPQARHGYDLALTEVLTPEHFFVLEAGSPAGQEVLDLLALPPASPEEVTQARDVVEQTAQNMGRSMDTTDIKELFYNNVNNARWDDVADRCLSCANCTLVCPTCFCTEVEDVTDLTGDHAERWRRWDSCFHLDFSYVHGGPVRRSVASRYRQWITHKLASWHDQFDTSGCVGCGRCITWCPVGIDITEETAAIRNSDSSSPSKDSR